MDDKNFTFGSLFAGIGGFDLGFERSGMTCTWQVEIDNKCNEVLAYHWPDVKRYGDVQNVGAKNLEPVDLVCGGFPCQDLSVAGRRAGLAGKRSGLWWEFHRIIAELNPAWVVIENVPGLLSSNKGRDMGALLWSLGQFGYGWAYRCLDAQYDNLAQRRKRVFIVGYSGNMGGLGQTTSRQELSRLASLPVKVLFESESLSWDSAPSREAGAGVARDVVYCIDQGGGKGMSHFMLGQAYPLVESMTPHVIAHQCYGNNVGPMGTLRSGNSGLTGGVPFIAWHENQQGELTPDSDGIAKALRAGASHSYQGVGVRRLTPTECERLQGFPDNWTAINGMSNSARYKMLGNAVAVPVVEWIGKRIMKIIFEQQTFI